jgi:hypothetical protein
MEANACIQVTLYRDETTREVVIFPGLPRRPLYALTAELSNGAVHYHHRPAHPQEIRDANWALLNRLADRGTAA